MNRPLTIGFWFFAAYLMIAAAIPTLRGATVDFVVSGYDLISQAPAQFWGVVAGSIFTLGGVVLSNIYLDRRAEVSLDHDRQQKQIERAMSIRREVFLNAVDAIAVGMASLSRYAYPALSDDEIAKPYLEKMSAVSKLQVIAEFDACEATLNVVSELTQAILRIAPHRYALMARHAELEQVKSQLAISREDHSKILDISKDDMVAGRFDANLQAQRDIMLKTISKTISELQPKETTAQQEVFRASAATLQAALQELKQITALLPNAIIAARRELQLNIDETRFRDLVISNGKRNADAISDFLNQMEKNMAQR